MKTKLLEDKLNIRRCIRRLIDDELQEAEKLSLDDRVSRSSSFLEKVALEELGELRKQLMAELATFRMSRERGPLLRMLNPDAMLNSTSGSSESPSLRTSASSSPSVEERPESEESSNRTSEKSFPVPGIPISIPPIEIRPSEGEHHDPTFTNYTENRFRNVIQAVEFPERGPGRTQSLADTERSTQNSGEDSERVFSRLESLVEALEARRRLRSRIDEVHEKKDAATSPVQPDGVSTGRLSEYRHAFDEEFSSSDPSSDPSIGQIRLEPLDLGSRPIISVLPDGSVIRTPRTPRIVESEDEAESSSQLETSSGSFVEELSCRRSDWGPPSRVLTLNFADIPSSAIETFSARDRHSSQPDTPTSCHHLG